MICRLGKDIPQIIGYVAESAQVIGKVQVLANASVWMGAVLRGDVESIIIGKGSNVQENCSLHTSYGLPLQIGENVSIGHNATLHSCTIGSGSLIGMGVTLLDGVEIGTGSLVAADSLLTPGSKFPENSFILGSPAERKKELGTAAREEILDNAKFYTQLSQRYQNELVVLRQNIRDQSLGELQWKLAIYVPLDIQDNHITDQDNRQNSPLQNSIYNNTHSNPLATEALKNPTTNLLEELKTALFQAGAGALGLYRHCSWQVEGVGQFMPLPNSQPAIGTQQELCRLPEYKLELLCSTSCLKPVLDALYRVHPYETPAYEIYPLYSPIASMY